MISLIENPFFKQPDGIPIGFLFYGAQVAV